MEPIYWRTTTIITSSKSVGVFVIAQILKYVNQNEGSLNLSTSMKSEKINAQKTRRVSQRNPSKSLRNNSRR